jgi:hypothetical protein
VPGQNDDARAPAGKDMPPIGAVLGGRFHLEAMLGRGGTGVVFRAFDRVMGEPVAVKLLFPERAEDQGWIRRLVREVKVARTIVHPNVRRIFEIAQVDGWWLITMELGTGSLGDQLRGLPHGDEPRRRPLPPWPERRDDARAVVDGLAAIHVAGITHRDVTPNNVLRMSDGRLVLSDFGLALLDGETTALIAGTPNYVAPEVLAGERADQRSDVWQLGLVLHEIVFERRPRWDRTDGRQELLPPIGLDDDTPLDELMRILGACLSVDRKRRAPTAVDIAQLWERATTTELGARRARRWLVPALVAGALAVAAGLAATRLRPRHDRGDEALAVAPAAPAPVAAPRPAAAAAPASAARVHIHLDSRPSHARVVDVATSEPWGTTPLDVERPPSTRAITLRLAKPRFESAVVTIGGDRDLTETVELRARREPAEPAPQRPVEETTPAPAPPAVEEPEKL